MKRALFLLLCTFPVFADEVGPEIAVTETAAVQQNVVISRTGVRTLVALEETPAEGQPSRIVLHQFEAFMGVPLGRETFAVRPSSRHQRRPALSAGAIGWIEEEPDGGNASLWWDGLGDIHVGSNFRPIGQPERLADVKSGTRIAILNTHVFDVLLWTSPQGSLKGVYRAQWVRIGYDPTPFDVTYETALNPAVASARSPITPLIAYNHPAGAGYGIRATTLGGRFPQTAVTIAPEGASAPRVVFSDPDFVVFWSMPDGATYAQRVSTAGGQPVKLGEPRKIHDGVLHGASSGPNDAHYLVVEEGMRYAVLRLDRELAVVERTPFSASPAAGASISLSGDAFKKPMLAYPEFSSRAVMRTIEERETVRRRRSVR